MYEKVSNIYRMFAKKSFVRGCSDVHKNNFKNRHNLKNFKQKKDNLKNEQSKTA